MLWQEWSFPAGLGYSGPKSGFPVLHGSGSSERQGQGDGKAGVEGKGIGKLRESKITGVKIKIEI